jgi:hypothetical protein
MKPVILFRPSLENEDELRIVRESGLDVVTQRSLVPANSIVIGRYSVLPFYKELEYDLFVNGSYLINDLKQHSFIADVMSWSDLLGDLTPKTWDRMDVLPEGMSFVVKGQTNSRKDRWSTHMFAKDKHAAIDVTLRLQEDSLIQSQRIYYREYVPLSTINGSRDLITGMPIGREYRFFCLNGKVLTGAWYWSSHVDRFPGVDLEPPPIAFQTAESALDLIGDQANFVVVDVAQTADGRWIVIELNDGQMSGLSETDPVELYRKIKETV